MQSDVNDRSTLKQLSAFLNEGAIVQTELDTFKVFVGPFTSVEVLNSEQDILYKPDFWDFLQNKPIESNLLRAQKVIDFSRSDLYELLSELILGDLDEPSQFKINWQTTDKFEFQQQFIWLQSCMKKAELKKGLPIAVQKGLGFLSKKKTEILKNILLKKSEQYLYGFWDQNSGFIGYTPEILIECDDSQVSTMALAGTWSKHLPAPDFEDVKIRNEHQLVVEDILRQLSTESLISKSETEVLELEYLFHLKTKFRYGCKNLDQLKGCIKKLHPTAALGLFPRSEKLSMEFNNFKLQKNRKNFGAPFGFIGATKSLLLVAIRNIFWSNDEVLIYSGCGVTADSDFETEYEEIIAKRNSVKKTFGLNL